MFIINQLFRAEAHKSAKKKNRIPFFYRHDDEFASVEHQKDSQPTTSEEIQQTDIANGPSLNQISVMQKSQEKSFIHRFAKKDC